MPDPYIDPSYWEPPDDDTADNAFFAAFAQAVRESAPDPCPICGDELRLVDRDGHMWDEHGDSHLPGDQDQLT